MLHNLERFTRKYVLFNSEELFKMVKLFQPLSIEESNFVIQGNQSVSHIYFLDNGEIKSYIENKGKQHKVKFYFAPVFFSDVNAIKKGSRAKANFVTIKESSIFYAKFSDISKLTAKSTKHKSFFEMIFEDNYMFDANISK